MQSSKRKRAKERERERKIHDTLSRRKRMKLVKHDTCDISNRIKQIEDGYFILQDCVNGKYEVHSTYNIGNTYCFAVPYNVLDARTLDYCRETRAESNVLLRIKQNNEKIEQSLKRANKGDLKDRSLELADRVSFALQKDELHDGYKRVYSMK